MKTELDSIGGYRLVTLLGTGGMGDVYFGVSQTADPVAVKVIRSHLVSGHQVRERFAGEVENLKMIFGSRVARLEDADPFGDPAWLATEYVPGLTLKQYVELRQPLPANLAAMVGAMLADGLAKVHLGGLLHRDLKPQNVILGPSGPVLIDFGLAVLAERETALTEVGVAVGTPAYMAPEQVRGDKDLSAAIDIYGLGAALAFALTGRTLYPGVKRHDLFCYIADPGQLPDLSDVPAVLSPLIGGMLAFDPGARPSLSTVATRLLKVATGQGDTAVSVRQRVVEMTYDDTRRLEIPAALTDPSEDPQDLVGDAGAAEVGEEPREPEAAAEPGDAVAPAAVRQADLTWLLEKLRGQYARRPTL